MGGETGIVGPRRSWPLPLLVGLAVLLALVWRFDFLCDDAYISFRYSKHFAEGHGLRFNLVPGRPVEGYSNFLWVVYLALFELLHVDVGAAAKASGTACAALLLFWFVRTLARRLDGPRGTLALVLGTLFLASLPPVAVWSTGGLATLPFTLLLFVAAERLLADPERPHGVASGVAGLAAALLRADGAAFVLLVHAVGLLAWRRTGRRALLRATLVAAAVLVAGVGAHVVWRYAYYGDWLPNTARIKAGFSADRLGRGSDYLAVFLLTFPSCLVALVFGVSGALRRGGTLGLAALAVVLANLAYAAYVGGDFMAMGRFLVPMMPFLALLLAHGVQRGLEGGAGARRTAVLLAAGCVALNLLPVFGRYPTPGSLRARFHFRFNNPEYWDELRMWRSMKRNARIWRRDGLALAEITRPGESMILGPVGAIGYYSGLTLYDLYGLTSRDVAAETAAPRQASPGHDRFVQPHFFFDKQPTYLGYTVVAAPGPRVKARLPGFMQRYADLVEIEPHPAREELGYPAGREIWLVRLRR